MHAKIFRQLFDVVDYQVFSLVFHALRVFGPRPVAKAKAANLANLSSRAGSSGKQMMTIDLTIGVTP